MIRDWFKRPLWQRILVAFLLGISAGFVFGPTAGIWFKSIGDLYLNLIQLIVIPLILFSIPSSIARITNNTNAIRLTVRTLFWFLTTSALAVSVGLLFGHSIKPGSGIEKLQAAEFTQRVIPSLADVVVGIIPRNLIKAMADGNILQVLIFAAFIGIALVMSGEKTKEIRTLFFQAEILVFCLVRGILQLTPIGTFGLIAWVVNHYGVSSLMPLGKFIFTMYMACLFHIIFVYGGLLKAHGLNVGYFFKSVLPAQQMAFATSSSIATLPLSLRIATERLGVAPAYANFALPFAANLKMDGCGAIYPAIAALFIAQYFAVDLSSTHYMIIYFLAVFGSLGTAGVPGTSIVMLTLTLTATGLPLQGIGLIIAIDRIIDMIRTATNVTGQILVSVLVAKEENILDAPSFTSYKQPDTSKISIN